MNKKELAQKIMELEDGYDGAVEFFSSTNEKQTCYILCLVSTRPMTSDDVLMALEVFVNESAQAETDLLAGNPVVSASDH